MLIKFYPPVLLSNKFEITSLRSAMITNKAFAMQIATLPRPNEEGGLDVTCSTQYMDAVQRTIATTLGIKESTINMSVRRLGGAFGGKVCLLACHSK